MKQAERWWLVQGHPLSFMAKWGFERLSLFLIEYSTTAYLPHFGKEYVVS